MKKAQVQFDYIVAFFIFLIVVFFVAFITFRPITESSGYVKETKFVETSNRVSELLIKTKGQPENWETDPDNVGRLGLASEPWVLDIDKVNATKYSLNYSQIKNSLDLDNYQFFLRVNSPSINVSIGNLPNNIQNVAMVKRYAVLNDQTATVTVGIW
ncbi:MAG: hypothetical protein JSW73_03470 [Candidatus Woesearchaeota archaeon]|nr:MAG: hypothetical protein JSW73_03470 [Candidatus Woesearchaeota archaeon]